MYRDFGLPAFIIARTRAVSSDAFQGKSAHCTYRLPAPRALVPRKHGRGKHLRKLFLRAGALVIRKDGELFTSAMTRAHRLATWHSASAPLRLRKTPSRAGAAALASTHCILVSRGMRWCRACAAVDPCRSGCAKAALAPARGGLVPALPHGVPTPRVSATAPATRATAALSPPCNILSTHFWRNRMRDVSAAACRSAGRNAWPVALTRAAHSRISSVVPPRSDPCLTATATIRKRQHLLQSRSFHLWATPSTHRYPPLQRWARHPDACGNAHRSSRTTLSTQMDTSRSQSIIAFRCQPPTTTCAHCCCPCFKDAANHVALLTPCACACRYSRRQCLLWRLNELATAIPTSIDLARFASDSALPSASRDVDTP